MPPSERNPYDNAPPFNRSQEQRISVCLNAEGVLTPKSFAEEQDLAQFLIKTGCLPGGFRNTSQLIMAMQWLKQHNVPFLAGIRCISIIRGALTVWGDLPLALVKRSGLMNEKLTRELWADANYNILSLENKNLHQPAAMCVVHYARGEGGVIERWFTLKDAEQAGLLKAGPDSPWQKYRKRMLQMRARGHALKDLFPDVLTGISIREYDHADEVSNDATPEAPQLDRIKQALSARQEPEPMPEAQEPDIELEPVRPSTPDSRRKAVLNELGYDV